MGWPSDRWSSDGGWRRRGNGGDVRADADAGAGADAGTGADADAVAGADAVADSGTDTARARKEGRRRKRLRVDSAPCTLQPSRERPPDQRPMAPSLPSFDAPPDLHARRLPRIHVVRRPLGGDVGDGRRGPDFAMARETGTIRCDSIDGVARNGGSHAPPLRASLLLPPPPRHLLLLRRRL